MREHQQGGKIWPKRMWTLTLVFTVGTRVHRTARKGIIVLVFSCTNGARTCKIRSSLASPYVPVDLCKQMQDLHRWTLNTAVPITQYPLQPEGVYRPPNWWMVRSPCGISSCTSNLFHLFQSNYQSRCLWSADYHWPASLAAGLDRHTAIGHFTIWAQGLSDELSGMTRAFVRSLGSCGWQKSSACSLPLPRELVWW